MPTDNDSNSDTATVKKSFSKKLVSYLNGNPSENDVVFLVGRTKEKVSALKIALKATCPALDQLFQTRLDTSGGMEGGIPLPHLDPVAFQTFLNLLLWDDWVTDEIEEMNLELETILNLISISKEYEMIELVNIFESLAEECFKEFSTFSNSNEFLELSRNSLETLLGSNCIPSSEVDIFQAACKWATLECLKQNLDATGENFRLVLGDAFFKIRFPIMKAADFVEAVSIEGILTESEQLQILKFIVTRNCNALEAANMLFNTQKRQAQSTRISSPSIPPAIGPACTANFFKDVKIVNDPPFVCDGSFSKIVFITPDTQIVLQSIGFLGPIEQDSEYQVIVKVVKVEPGKSKKNCREVYQLKKRVQARRQQVFYVSLDTLLDLVPFGKPNFDVSNGCYAIRFSLKGPSTQSAELLNEDAGVKFSTTVDGVTITSKHDVNQLAGLIFRKS